LIEAKDDRIILTATDLELGIRCPSGEGEKEGAGTIPARKLLDHTRLLPDGDLNMKFLENHWASITRAIAPRLPDVAWCFQLPQMPEAISRSR
jgi:DNA polymerase-3 subunit beta